MHIAIHGVKIDAHSYTWSDMHIALIVLFGVKLYAHYYTWSEALCSILYNG